MDVLIATAVATIMTVAGCARFDPRDEIQLVPASTWSAADVETLRQAAQCWNLRFGARFAVVETPTANQVVDVAYNDLTCWAADGRYSFGLRGRIDVCPPEHSRVPLPLTREARLFAILAHELGHAAGIRQEGAEYDSVMGHGGYVEFEAGLRRQMFGDEDALLLEATNFAPIPVCDGETVLAVSAARHGGCGCQSPLRRGPKWGLAAAHDSERGITLVLDVASRFWTWDGTRWRDVAPTLSPPPRSASAMVYDPNRKRIVLFGGVSGWSDVLADTWEWDGSRWIEMSPTASPPGRGGHMLAYDPDRGRVVLFGGDLGNEQWSNDLWEYDGVTWTPRFPSTLPPARTRGAFGFDPAGRTLLLYGGFAGHDLADQWAWNGTEWSAITTSAAPGPRKAMGLVVGSTHLLLFGGAREEGNLLPSLLDDLWEWDGAAWREILLPFGPTPRSHFAFAFDGNRGRAVLTGGFGVFRDEVWEWDNQQWVDIGFAQCSNGNIEEPEECDDGNLAPGDGCDERCQLE